MSRTIETLRARTVTLEATEDGILLTTPTFDIAPDVAPRTHISGLQLTSFELFQQTMDVLHSFGLPFGTEAEANAHVAAEVAAFVERRMQAMLATAQAAQAEAERRLENTDSTMVFERKLTEYVYDAIGESRPNEVSIGATVAALDALLDQQVRNMDSAFMRALLPEREYTVRGTVSVQVEFTVRARALADAEDEASAMLDNLTSDTVTFDNDIEGEVSDTTVDDVDEQ